jgi:hypothetical protein
VSEREALGMSGRSPEVEEQMRESRRGEAGIFLRLDTLLALEYVSIPLYHTHFAQWIYSPCLMNDYLILLCDCDCDRSLSYHE